MSANRLAPVQIALMSAWLGAALLTSASVAPAAFAVLSDRSLAGEVVGPVLSVVFVCGFVCSGLAMVLTPMDRRVERWMVFSSGILCLVTQLVIVPHMAAIRLSVGRPINSLPIADSQRVEFGRLHLFSVAMLGISMLAAFVYIFMCLRSELRTSEPSNG